MKQKLLKPLRLRVLMLVALLCAGFTSAWGDVVSGQEYATTAIESLPNGWSGEDGDGTSYIKLIDSEHFIQTSEFSQNGFTSITVKARKFGGPTDNQALITVSWYDKSTEAETVLGTVVPANTTLTNYTISSPTNPKGSTTGYVKIQCKGASSSKGSGVSAVTITYTGGSNPPTYTVTYDANGGTGTMTDSNSPYNSGATVTVLGNSFTRDGYTFKSWNTAANGSGTSYDEDDTFSISGNTTLYAQWTENTPAGNYNWVLTDISALTATDVFVIVGNNYAMTNNNGTSSAPSAVFVTIDANMITSTVEDKLMWTISGDATNGYTFYPNGSTTKWLYCNTTSSSSNNNNMRVGIGGRKIFEPNTNGYFVTKDTHTKRYISIYDNSDWRGYTSTSSAVVLKFYKRVNADAPQPPFITADNVDIAYDASNGSIAYTLTNPVDGGVVTANTTADWLTIGTVAENSIPFSCKANAAGTERSATVTLTYTYNTNETITKDVIVTQAANPNFAMTIAEVRAQGTGSVVTKGVVTSTYGKNAYIQDADAAIVVRTDGDLTCVVGDEIRVSGTLGDYNGLLQIQNANITKLTSGNTTTPEAMTIANVNNSTNQGWLVKIVDATVTAISDKNVTIEQGEYSIEVRFNNATDITFAVNDILTLTGNIGHYNGSNQIANPTDVEKKVLTPVTLTFTDVPETITKGETTICKVTAEPSVEGITYSSSDENIVKVGIETGEITAMGIGTATITANYAGDSDHSSATASYTIQVIGAPYTATFYVNGDKLSEATVNEGSDITFPVVEEQEINGKKFVGWTTAAIDGTTNDKPKVLVTSATMGDDNVNYYAVYANVESEGSQTTVTDVLTRETTGVPDQTNENNKTYSTWEGKEGSSGAVYAGQSAGDKNSIQLRSNNNNSGVITTTSGGSVKKVVVAWKDDTTEGRTLNVYGNKSAYSAAADLYGDNAGTLLGTIVKGTSTELTITGDYEYIGLRSASGAMYLDEIDITWESGTPATYSGYCTTVVAPVVPAAPIIFHDSGEYEGELKVAIAGEGTIKYQLGDGAEQTYTAPFTISETTTIKAWAVKDGVASDVTEPKTFTIKEKAKGAVVEDGYYTIQTNDDKYVNVAGRKTVTLVSDTKSAGTVIRVKADEDGVKVLRSQAVDLPRYAERAMSYVPELVKEVVKKLAANVDDPIIGEQGADLILDKFNKEFDYHLYLEGENNTYRIYGRTPSMKPVVDFYAENKQLVDSRLPKVEDFVKEVLQKIVDKVGRGQSVVDMFKVKTIWEKMGGKLTDPDVDQAKFFEEVLTSEENVWSFAYQTGMLYWDKVESYLNDNISELGDYGKYIEKIPHIRPNFRYYIVPGENGVDIISEGNSQITDASTAWTLTKREGFDVTFDATLSKNNGKEMYKTLYVDFAYELPENENVKALKVESVSDAGVAVTKEITGVVPAQTPVLLMSTDVENLTKTLSLSTADGAAVTDNLLVGADYLINEYEINTPQVESIFSMLAELSQSLANEYSYLKRKNAGTVNNKYFFGIAVEGELNKAYKEKTGDDMENTPVRILSMGNQKLGFYGSWDPVKNNEAFIVTENEELDPVKLIMKGDVYRDGVIDEKDLTALVEIVLGKVTIENKPDNYDFDAAYVNDDEYINIADVTALVNILK